MRKFFTPVFLILGIVFSTKAQIIINRSDLGNFIGKVYINANDTSNVNLISPGSAGANQSWNLSGLSNNNQDTLTFTSASSATCTNAFPNATLALNQGTATTYIKDSNTSIEFVGYCDQAAPISEGVVALTPPRKLINFPLTFNTSFSGQSSITLKVPNNTPPPDSLKFISKTLYSVLVDGWGQVTTPAGTYTALRKKTTSFINDSIFVLIDGNWVPTGEATIDTTLEFEWYGQNSLFIASLRQDGHGVTTSASFLLTTTTEVKELQESELKTNIFPNPSNGRFTVRSKGTSKGLIEIFNAPGSKIATAPMASDETDLDLTTFRAGIYYLKIKDGARLESHKIRIE